MQSSDQAYAGAFRAPEIPAILGRLPVTVALLDERRQVVFGQDRLLKMIGAMEPPASGRAAPGDLVACVNALASGDGCGTSEACSLCGAYCAISQSRRNRSSVTRECRIRCAPGKNASDLDITVTAMPYESSGRTYTLLTILDASSDKRKRALERLFFHDIANIAGGLAGIAHALRSASNGEEREEMLHAMEHSAHALLDEIEAQRQLASAEAGDLPVAPREVTSSETLGGVVDALRYHSVSRGRRLVVDDDAELFSCVTDPVLLRRVLVNLAKNALEATPTGGTVTLGSAKIGNEATFSVHNAGAIPMEVQHQLFQRSFSTKGDGRGLGAYSVRLLTEQYLGGRVSFRSTESDGTRFTVTVPEG